MGSMARSCVGGWWFGYRTLTSGCPYGHSAWFRLTCLESGDGLGGCVGDLDQEQVAVVDAEAVADGRHVDSLAGVAEADLDTLPGHHDGAAAAGAPLQGGRSLGD